MRGSTRRRASNAGFARASLGYHRCRRGGPPSWPQRRSLEVSRTEPYVRYEAEGNEVTVGVAWLWCIVGCLAWWVLVAWAVERVV
jgi:hypothetical protein